MTERDRAAELDRAFRRYCADGTEEDLARVFVVVAASLRREAVAILRDEAAADDLVQSTFVAAIERRADFDPARGGAYAWLRGLLRNRARHAIRARRREADRREEFGEPVLEASADVALQELAVRTREAIERLPEPYASSVRRVILHGESAEQVAADTQRPASTVRGQVRRGVQRLRNALPTVLSAMARAISAGPLRVAAAAGVVLAVGALLIVPVGGRGPHAASGPPPGGAADSEAMSGAGSPQATARPGRRRVAQVSPVPAVEPDGPSSPGERLAVTLRADRDGSVLAETWVVLSGQGGSTQLARTDADGRLEGGALAAAERVQLPWARVDQPLAGMDEVPIPPGFELRGRVLDAADRPVVDAAVMWCPDIGERFPLLELARTNREGVFRARHLSPSRMHRLLAVTDPSSFRAVDLEAMRSLAIEAGGSTGATVSLTLRLQDAAAPAAAVETSAASRPAPDHSVWLECLTPEPARVEGWTIALLAHGDDAVLWAGTLRRGGTELIDPPTDAGHAVLLPANLDQVAVSSRPLTRNSHSRRVPLRREAGRWTASFATADLPCADFDLQVVGGARTVVALDDSGRPAWIGRWEAGDRGRVGPLPTGRWTLAAMRPDGLWLHSGPFALRRVDETQSVRIEPPPGTARLRWILPAGVDPASTTILLCSGGAPLARQPDPQNDAEILLVPGDYELFWTAPGFAVARLPLALAADETTARLPAHSGEPVEIVLRFTAASRPVDDRASVDLQLLDPASGDIRWRERVHGSLDESGGLSLTRWLPPGPMRWVASDRRGARAELQEDHQGSGRVVVLLDH